MPKKTVAVAAIESGATLYLFQPDNLIKKVSIIAITWIATDSSYKMSCKLWKIKSNKLKKEWDDYQNTPEGIKSKSDKEEIINKYLDDFFENPEFLEKIGLNK